METNSFIGCLLGTALGDAIGLPCEGLSAARRARRFGTIDGHRLLFGHGMISDDTEHTVLVAQALIASAGEPTAFGRHLAAGLRGWFLALPPGVGIATVRACLRLLVGFGPERSGVWSAGNGPAMRAALLGVFCANDPDETRLLALVRVSTRITHTDPRAEAGALAIARAARTGCVPPTPLPEPGYISGFVEATVPAALAAVAAHPTDFRAAITTVVALGGDTDTTGAIVGGLVGARVGKAGLPTDWLAGLAEWPRTRTYLERLASQLAEVAATGKPQKPLGVAWPLVFLRNLFLLVVVLAHGFRRLLP